MFNKYVHLPHIDYTAKVNETQKKSLGSAWTNNYNQKRLQWFPKFSTKVLLKVENMPY